MVSIKKIYLDFEKHLEKTIKIKGWVSNLRGNLKIKFLDLNDGSTVENLQIVLKENDINLELVDKARLGAAVEVEGILKESKTSKQKVELEAKKFNLLKNTDEDFPIQKKEISREALREIPHLRHRTKLLKTIMLIRSTLTFEVHNFFNENGFLNMAAPIITSNDGEGSGEMFIVDDESEKHFFGKVAKLGVTGQLHAEAYAVGLNKVYTFAPIFRAENSHTKKHAAEFWMIEPEVAFYDLQKIIKLADQLLKYVIKNTLKKNKSEFKFLESTISPGIIEKLSSFISSPVNIIEYKDAIEILKKERDVFEEKNIYFGMDLATEHERYLAENVFNAPVCVINYPKGIKAFYMFLNPDNETVASFDMLVPGIGELIGGSQRENDYQKLVQRIKELNIPQDEMQWYLDLRRFGDAGSSGFGVGFERLIMFVTGIDNIRDTIPFPRTTNNLKT
ncbi:asparagine--tRNA ligase [Mesomycoplasma neurolyticum]|uniref:Asparagine--tRNA ligase n=1 Tax=Mesomycoplasma neurolyticum TaxID=2120 RepID=A0A449A4C8_9BACT|nr:asparagine--tRNA ligase [Mesomycoplasma neurolyticum]VEU59097.1 lysyl-tRNA synthetase [Mesomycoplasma neurolyticum]